jgi:hypothetical protein
MASLQVSATIVTGAASPGSAGPAFAAVSVTDENGVPVSGQSDDNFRFTVIANPGGEPEPMTHRLNTERGDGFYLASLFRRSGQLSDTWAAGDYLTGVQVNISSRRGQTVATLHIPPFGQAPSIKSGPEVLMSQLRGYEVVAVQKNAAVSPGEIVVVDCPCPKRKIIIGGGADVQALPPGSSANYTLKSSTILNIPGDQKWEAIWTNATHETNPQVVTFIVFAICIDAN